ncbi:MAG: carbohydrate ABC transporter substrate-binding protein [Clostridia bacterium]|nr:carbohydrate ABC transporter substrate-binding protein [Clostridia bacterium]
MKCNRIYIFSILLVLALLTLCSCHGSRSLPTFVMPDTFDTTRTYEITFWAKNDTNITQTRIYQKAIEDFQALYPNIRVNLRLYTNYGNIYNDVITNIATNTTPNVCITYPDHIATYRMGTNTVVNLDTLMNDAELGLGGSALRFSSPKREEIIPKYLSECMIDGAHYALPYMRSTEACYINKTYVEALGYTVPDVLTWDFIWEVSEAATAKNEDGLFSVNGQSVLIPFIYKSTDNMMIQYLAQSDAGYSTDTGDILIFNEQTEDFLYEIASHVQTGAFSTFKISSYPANFLNAGQCIFAIDSTAGATWMGCNAPLVDIAEENLVQFETVVRPIPQCNPDAPEMISQGPSVCIFNKKDPQEVLASWLFTQFLLTNEVQISYAQTEGYVPVTQSAQNDPVYTDYLSRAGEDNELYYDVKIAASRLTLAHTENTFVTPVYNGSASLRDAAGQMIENVAKSVRRKQEINDAYMDKLEKDITALYRLGEGGISGNDKRELGPMPSAAVGLLTVLSVTWLGIGVYSAAQWRRKRKFFQNDAKK